MSRLDYLIKKNVKVLDKIPSWWRVISNATNQPLGYVWINNNKSHFSKEYQHALLKNN